MLERSAPPSLVGGQFSSIVAALGEQGIDVRLVDGAAVPTFAATTHGGQEITYGCGKGAHAYIGAFGECVEHVHLWLLARDGAQVSQHVPRDGLYLEDPFVRAGAFYLNDSKECRALWYKDAHGHGAYLPLDLVSVFSEGNNSGSSDSSLFYKRYASSSGTAFGSSRDEALLHGLLEVIERHEFSRFLLAILGRSGTTYQRITEYSFSKEIETAAEIIKAGPCELLTLLTISHLGPIFAVTVATKYTINGSQYRFWGAGCSLFRDLAIYRSVTECRQMMLGSEPSIQSARMAGIVAKYPALGAIARLELDQVDVASAAMSSENLLPRDVSEQISEVLAGISRSGRNTLWYVHPSLTSDYSVVSCFISSTEKFFGVTHSVPAVPLNHLEALENGSGPVAPRNVVP